MTTVEKHTDDDEVGLEHAEEFARTHPGLVKFGRIGWVAKGVVYALTGFLALLIAFDRLPGAEATQSPGQEASQSGAIARIAERTTQSLKRIVFHRPVKEKSIGRLHLQTGPILFLKARQFN